MNYKQIYAMKAEREKRIKKICPGIPYSSGIYAFIRADESGLKMAYIGQAKKLSERCASHLAEYDHLGLSLKKRGFYSGGNPYGWKLIYEECECKELDEKEQESIRRFANCGYQLLNKTSGSQGSGKKQIAEYKPRKTYRQGVQYGKKSLAKELKHIVDTHLTVTIRPEKQNNKISIKALEKFTNLIDEDNYKEGD